MASDRDVPAHDTHAAENGHGAACTASARAAEHGDHTRGRIDPARITAAQPQRTAGSGLTRATADAHIAARHTHATRTGGNRHSTRAPMAAASRHHRHVPTRRVTGAAGDRNIAAVTTGAHAARHRNAAAVTRDRRVAASHAHAAAAGAAATGAHVHVAAAASSRDATADRHGSGNAVGAVPRPQRHTTAAPSGTNGRAAADRHIPARAAGRRLHAHGARRSTRATAATRKDHAAAAGATRTTLQLHVAAKECAATRANSQQDAARSAVARGAARQRDSPARTITAGASGQRQRAAAPLGTTRPH